MSENRHVFISYSSKDVGYVMQLANAMDVNNIAYWRAPDKIPAGSNYAKEIPKAIRECDLFLLIYSSNAQESIWVEKEVDTAVCCKKPILPIRIDDSDFNELFKFYLNNVQMVQAEIISNKIINLTELIGKIINLKQAQNSEVEAVVEGAVSVKHKSNLQDKLSTIVEYNTQKRGVDKRSNALRINRIPLECEYCGGGVQLKSIGVYVCEKCGRENYDDFYKVRNYLETHGPAPAIVIARSTGVSRASIEHYLNS